MAGEKNCILKVSDLKKEYPSGFSLGAASFSIFSGETVAFLGPNGAGKSTLFQMLSGNSDPTSGSILLSGKKLHPEAHVLKRMIGYLPQNMQLPRWVTGREVLNYAASLYQVPGGKNRVVDLMKYWDCEAYQNKPLAACSHGMQKRVGLALSCIHSPDFLILDEPFSGLDLYHIQALKDEIKNRMARGLATILSTHIAPYVAQLCSSALIIQEGKISELEGWSRKATEGRITHIEEQFF